MQPKDLAKEIRAILPGTQSLGIILTAILAFILPKILGKYIHPVK